MAFRQSPSIVHEHLTCEILVTNSCNMNCDYCIAKNLPGPSMRVEIGRKAIDMFVYLSKGGRSIEFIFTGGEPLTEYEVFKDLLSYAQKRACEASIQAFFILKTNGTILNQNIIDFMRLNCIKVIVSIDGTPSIHNRHRKTASGKVTHSIVCRNLQTLLKNQISCVASVTVHPDSSQSVLENIRYLKELGVEQIDIGPAYGTITWSDIDCFNLSRSLMKVAGYIRQMNIEGYRIRIGPLYQESEHVGGVLSNQWGCHAASTNLAFLPNGQITGCSSLAMLISKFPELILGDVFNGLDQLSINRLIHLAQAKREDRPLCKNCKTSINCTGGCLAINYSTSGKAFIPPNVYCKTISTIPKAWCRAWGTSYLKKKFQEPSDR